MNKWLRTVFHHLYSPDDPGSAGDPGGGAGSGEPDASGADPGGPSDRPADAAYPKYHEQFPQEIRGHDLLKAGSDWLKPADIAKGYVELKERAGKSVVVPGENATPEERAEFFKSLGRPDSPGGYTLSKPEGWPEQLPWSEDETKELASILHESGVSKQAGEAIFQKLMRSNLTKITQAQASNQARKTQWEKQLAERYGDRTDEVLRTVDRAFKAVGSPELGQDMAHRGLTRNPLYVDAFYRMFQAVGEDKLFTGALADPAGVQKSAEGLFPNTNWRR